MQFISGKVYATNDVIVRCTRAEDSDRHSIYGEGIRMSHNSWARSNHFGIYGTSVREATPSEIAWMDQILNERQWCEKEEDIYEVY